MNEHTNDQIQNKKKRTIQIIINPERTNNELTNEINKKLKNEIIKPRTNRSRT